MPQGQSIDKTPQTVETMQLSLAHGLWVDHNLNAAIALLTSRGGVRCHRVVGSVAEHKQLLGWELVPIGKLLEDGHGLRRSQLVLIAPGGALDRPAVGMRLDADHLLGIVLANRGGDMVDQARGGFVQRGRAWHEDTIGWEFDPNHVSVLTDQETSHAHRR